jgi:hypothetical protein
MKRRSFLGLLGALPFAGLLVGRAATTVRPENVAWLPSKSGYPPGGPYTSVRNDTDETLYVRDRDTLEIVATLSPRHAGVFFLYREQKIRAGALGCTDTYLRWVYMTAWSGAL